MAHRVFEWTRPDRDKCQIQYPGFLHNLTPLWEKERGERELVPMAPKAKPKPAPPPPAAQSPPIEDLFSNLNRHVQNFEYDQAAKVADQGLISNFLFDGSNLVVRFLDLGFCWTFFYWILPVLAIAPGDEDAVRCKVVALIKSDAIDKALAAIQRFDTLPIELNFYKVFIFY